MCVFFFSVCRLSGSFRFQAPFSTHTHKFGHHKSHVIKIHLTPYLRITHAAIFIYTLFPAVCVSNMQVPTATFFSVVVIILWSKLFTFFPPGLILLYHVFLRIPPGMLSAALSLPPFIELMRFGFIGIDDVYVCVCTLYALFPRIFNQNVCVFARAVQSFRFQRNQTVVSDFLPELVQCSSAFEHCTLAHTHTPR